MPLSCWQYLSSSKSFIPVQLAHGATAMVSPTDELFQLSVCLKWDTTVWDGPIETLKFLNTKFSRKEKDLSYRRAQAGAQCVLVEAPASGAGSARVRLAWAGRWTWACPHKSGQTCPKLSTGTAVSTPCSWKHTAEEQRVLSSCPSHCSVMNTQCFPTAEFCKPLRSRSGSRQDKHLFT